MKNNRSISKTLLLFNIYFFLKNNFLIIHSIIVKHIITSPNTIIAPAPNTLTTKAKNANNINVINNKIINKNIKLPPIYLFSL